MRTTGERYESKFPSAVLENEVVVLFHHQHRVSQTWEALEEEGRAMFRVFSVPNSLGLERILVASEGSWHQETLGHYGVTGLILLATVTSVV